MPFTESDCDLLMDSNAPITLTRRRNTIAAMSLGVAIASILLFLLSRIMQIHAGWAFFGTLGAANAMLWCPALMYVGVRTKSWFVFALAFLGTLTVIFWLWVMIFW